MLELQLPSVLRQRCIRNLQSIIPAEICPVDDFKVRILRAIDKWHFDKGFLEIFELLNQICQGMKLENVRGGMSTEERYLLSDSQSLDQATAWN